jgi:hypothetical protein
MKKLVNILGAIGIVASASTSVIACGGGNVNSGNEFIENEILGSNAYSNEMKKMYQATSFMSKMMILSRHENLNYYLNDMIQGTYSNDSLLVSQAAGAPSTFNVKDSNGKLNTIDINKTYIDPLNNDYTPMGNYVHKYSKGDINLQSWMYAGMTYDDAYNTYIKNSINNGDNNYDYFGSADAGNGGFNGWALLNENINYGGSIDLQNYRKDRLNLKWMQTGGPLADYIFANDNLWKEGFDRDTRTAKYSRWISQMFLNNKDEGTAKGSGMTTITPDDDSIHYNIDNSTGDKQMKMGSLYQTVRNAEFNGKISNVFSNTFPILKQISKSDEGASIAGTFLHSLFPISKVSSLDDEVVGTVLYGLIGQIISFMKTISTSDKETDNVPGFTDNEELKNTLVAYQAENTKYKLPSLLAIINRKTFDFKAIADSNYFANISNVSDALSKINMDDKTQEKIWELFQDHLGLLNTLISQVFKGNPELISKVKDPKYLTSINLFGLVRQTIKLISSFNDYRKDYLDNYTEFSQNPYSIMKDKALKLFGWNKESKDWDENSSIGILNNVVNNSSNEGNLGLNRFVNDDDSIINISRNEGTGDIWNSLYKYILKDDYWDVKDYQYQKFDDNADDNLGDTISYTMNYNGLGDGSVDYKLLSSKTDSVAMTDGSSINNVKNKPVLEGVVGQFFNGNDGSSRRGYAAPMVRDSGGTLAGGLDNLIKMNGLGNIEDLTKVSHKYTVKWQNVSIDPNNPYWVVIAINAYNDNNQEYYYYY